MNKDMRSIIAAVVSTTAVFISPAATAQNTKPESRAAAATDGGNNTVKITPIG
jgi:hypothetical protein